MREIEFRGKCIRHGQWHYGYYITYSMFESGVFSSAINRHSIKRYDGGDIYDVIPETIGQHTGLKDKNGTKIFEGDALKYSSVPRVIEWNERYARYDQVRIDDGSSMFLDYEDAILCEIIGNIHDNPELLEANNDYREEKA